MNINETTVRVRYQETDQMGIAYHANYLVWFEVGRTELMRKIGMPYDEFEKSGLYLPVLKAYCEYRHAVRYDDLLTIVTRFDDLQNVRIVFKYDVRRESKLLASGYTEHAFINEKGRPIVLKKKNPFLWNCLLKALDTDSEGGNNE